MSKLELVDEPPTRGSEPEFHPVDLWRILVQHRWLVIGSLVVSLATAWVAAFLTRPVFRATTLIALEQERNSPLDIAAGALRERGSDVNSIETESHFLKSRDVLERVVRKLGLAEPGTPGGTGDSAAAATSVSPPSGIDPVTKAAMGLQRSIEIRQVRGTDLLEVNVTAHSAKKSADLANAVTEAYIAWKLDTRFRLLGQASTFLSEQIEEAKATLAKQEENLLTFSRSKNILTVDPRSSVTLTRLDSLSRDLAAATADRMAKEAREAEVRNVRPEILADTIQSGLVSQLRSEQARLEREYQEKLGLYKPDWPAMQQLKAKIEEGRRHLDAVVEETARKAREMARGDVLAAQRREELLRDSQKAEQAQAQALNSDVAQL